MEESPPPQLEDSPATLPSSQLIDELGALVEGPTSLTIYPRSRKAISSSAKAASRCSASPASCSLLRHKSNVLLAMAKQPHYLIKEMYLDDVKAMEGDPS
ncbi:hypothetical protein Acr_00g0100610 [Actinidia rufa]|uniref:Uncharacterized protein n=1 Tax=Actinidia rufa TaxID=165716 RepID=A0A7J0E0Y6_9ERIC|nr:hypothetical protein Acr_00g0100610 [Actinidia rufa]